MSFIDLLILAFALGIDCLIVSFSQGLIFKHKRILNSTLLGLTMGLCQGFMPFIGYIFTDYTLDFIGIYKNLVIFLIFMCLGMKFIIEGLSEKQEKEIQCIDWKCLAAMGIATSIDAMFSGVNLRLTDTALFISASIIGIVSFFMAFIGFWGGNFFKKLPANIMNISGGLILIFLAVKTVI